MECSQNGQQYGHIVMTDDVYTIRQCLMLGKYHCNGCKFDFPGVCSLESCSRKVNVSVIVAEAPHGWCERTPSGRDWLTGYIPLSSIHVVYDDWCSLHLLTPGESLPCHRSLLSLSPRHVGKLCLHQ